MSTHQVLPLPHPGRAPLAVLPVGPRDPAGPEGALDLGGSPGGLGGDAVAAAAAEESLWKRDSFFFRFFPSFRVSLLLRSLSLSLYLLSIFCTLTRCVMSFLGGTVGMPWKGKSIVGISSKTSACFFRFRVFYLFVERRFFFPCSLDCPLLLLVFLFSRTSFSGGIALRASQSQAPLPIDVAPDWAEAEADCWRRLPSVILHKKGEEQQQREKNVFCDFFSYFFSPLFFLSFFTPQPLTPPPPPLSAATCRRTSS